MSGPLVFLARNTHLATRNPKLRSEIEPEGGEDYFLSLPEFGCKIPNIRAETESVCGEDLFFFLFLVCT